MRTEKVAHHQVITDPKTAMVVMIVTVNLTITVSLGPVTAFAIFGDLNRGELLHITLSQLGRERKPPHIAGRVFGHFDVIDRVVLIEIEITNPWITGVDLLLKFGGILHRLKKSGHSLEVQPIGRLGGHRHIDVLIHIIAT